MGVLMEVRWGSFWRRREGVCSKKIRGRELREDRKGKCLEKERVWGGGKLLDVERIEILFRCSLLMFEGIASEKVLTLDGNCKYGEIFPPN